MVRGDGGTTVNLITTCYKEGMQASISGHVEPKSVMCFLRQMPFDLKTNKGKSPRNPLPNVNGPLSLFP